MPATAMNPSTRFFNAAITRVVFVPEISDKFSPTRAELDAGTDVSADIAELTGWQVTSEQVQTPDLATRFTSSIPGRSTAEESAITFYADREGEDVRELLPRDTQGYAVIMDHGDQAGLPVDVYPVRVASVGKMRSVGEEAARLEVQFSILSEPAENVTIPADGGEVEG